MFTCVSNPWWILTTTEWRHVTHVLYCDRFYLIGCKNCKTIHCYSRYFVASVLHTASHGRHIFGHYCGSQDYRSFVSRPRNRSVASVATMLERVKVECGHDTEVGHVLCQSLRCARDFEKHKNILMKL